MEVVMMAIWLITAPILIWCRWEGPVWAFNAVLFVNTISWVVCILKSVNWDFGK